MLSIERREQIVRLLTETIYTNPEDAQKDGRFRDSAKRTYYFDTTIDGEGLDMRGESRDARVTGEYERTREGRCLCSMWKQNIALHSVVRLAGAKRGTRAGGKGLAKRPVSPQYASQPSHAPQGTHERAELTERTGCTAPLGGSVSQPKSLAHRLSHRKLPFLPPVADDLHGVANLQDAVEDAAPRPAALQLRHLLAV